MDFNQRLGCLALWLNPGLQKPFLSKSLKPMCIISRSIHKRSHAIWCRYDRSRQEWGVCNFAWLCFMESVPRAFQVFRPVAKKSWQRCDWWPDLPSKAKAHVDGGVAKVRSGKHISNLTVHAVTVCSCFLDCILLSFLGQLLGCHTLGRVSEAGYYQLLYAQDCHNNHTQLVGSNHKVLGCSCGYMLCAVVISRTHVYTTTNNRYRHTTPCSSDT